MPVVPLPDLPAALPPRRRLLGLDLGEKTIGLALSDSRLTLASPLEVIRRKRFTDDAAALRRIVDGREVGGLVIGLPVNMDGSEGPRCQSVRQFARNLAELADLDLPTAFWDERLSTVAVNKFLIGELDMTRAKRAQSVDKLAAAHILQGALDALDALGPPPEEG